MGMAEEDFEGAFVGGGQDLSAMGQLYVNIACQARLTPYRDSDPADCHDGNAFLFQ